MSRETDLPSARLEIGESNVIYRHLLRGSGQPQEELWVEVRLDDDWVVAFLIEPEEGEALIAGLRVVPYEDDMERNVLLGPGESSRRSVPPRAVPLEKLRALLAEDVLRVAQDHLEAWPNQVEYLDAVISDFGLTTP